MRTRPSAYRRKAAARSQGRGAVAIAFCIAATFAGCSFVVVSSSLPDKRESYGGARDSDVLTVETVRRSQPRPSTN